MIEHTSILHAFKGFSIMFYCITKVELIRKSMTRTPSAPKGISINFARMTCFGIWYKMKNVDVIR